MPFNTKFGMWTARQRCKVKSVQFNTIFVKM